MTKAKKQLLILVALAIVVFGGTFFVISMTKNVNTPKSDSDVSEASAMAALDKLYQHIRVNTLPLNKGNVDLSEANLKDALPDISKYPPQVESTTADFIEIFSSPEKATIKTSPGQDTDRWLVDMAKAFNQSNPTIGDKPVSVRIRGTASGLGMDYISSGKYVPDAFTPSNELWGDALISMGVDATLVEKRLLGNVAGIVLKNEKNDELLKKYGVINLKSIVEAVAANELAMGYTNPFSSSTGANFLLSTLYSFDPTNPFSDAAVKAFEDFQANVPFVAYTTLQMQDAAKSGALDGFVSEYQQYVNAPELKSGYVFIPFGARHDNPVYAIGQLSDTKQEILKKFIAFCKTEANQKAATKYGFNNNDTYAFEIQNVTGTQLPQAQKLWKEKKSGNRDIIAVFVADVSGSMEGEPLNKLKQSLLEGSKFINPNFSVGLVTFSDDVNIALPIGKFDLNQRSYFTGAVEDMSAQSSTAMFDAIVVGEKLLMDAKVNNPNAKLMLFVLSDGETNVGTNLNDTRKIIEGLRVPIYTIGYNADIKVLSTISSINESASINADTEDVVYKIQNLFNAEM